MRWNIELALESVFQIISSGRRVIVIQVNNQICKELDRVRGRIPSHTANVHGVWRITHHLAVFVGHSWTFRRVY